MDNVIAFIIIFIGINLVCFRKKFAKSFVRIQNKTYGFHFGKKEVNANEWLLPFFGVLAVIIGILILVGVFQLK